MYKIEPRMQIWRRNLRIACSTDHVSDIPVRELKFKFKNWRRLLKIFLPSEVHILIKACQLIPLLGRSKLVRWYLKACFFLSPDAQSSINVHLVAKLTQKWMLKVLSKSFSHRFDTNIQPPIYCMESVFL